MNLLFDWLLIIFSSIILLMSYKKIIFKKNTSVANYIIAILYVFCVLPILLNYVIGIPKYNTVYWYKPFINAMNNSHVNIIYDIYIMACIFLLYFFIGRKKISFELKPENTLTSLYQNNKIIAYVLIFSPVILIILTGTWRNYLTFNVSASRGFSESSKNMLMTPCLLISVLTYFSIVFKNKMTLKKALVSIIYFFFIVWLSGKRFMIANILVLIIFYVVNIDIRDKTRNKMYKIIPIFAIFLIMFSAFYLIKVRPLSETSFDSVYEMLRVDFGRDDVIKFVINEEIEKENMILNYRGESFIALLGSFIPRKIWPSKPYPHYMYLTAAILDLSIFNLPAGTTPSLLEMTICNFGKLGLFIGVISNILLCYFIDKCRDIDRKAMYMILYIVLLTQSMDVYLIVIVFLILMKLFMILFQNKKIKFVWR